MNTLSPDVTQLTEPNSTTRPGAVDAAEVRQQLAGKHVCPFCGVIRADALQPCPRCTMEDSAATRSATRQRIGPWFVLQARNPSAPGMRYVTLLSLVRKGHVTPRSIVRGPTTHQLWTFAASVRGLSREFGLCYHCGEQIDQAAPNCPHCMKMQDLPPDPDALLEPVPEMSVSAQPTTTETGMDGGGTSLDLQADPYPDETPVPAPAVPRPAPPTASASQVAPQRLSRPSAPNVLATRQAIERAAAKEEAILSAKELAAAFQLDFKPPGQQTGRKFGFFRTAAALFLIGVVGVGVVMVLRPELREQSTAWLSDKWAGLRAELNKPANPPAPSKSMPAKPDSSKPEPAKPGPIKVEPAKPAPVAVNPTVTPTPTPDEAANTPVEKPVPAVVEKPIEVAPPPPPPTPMVPELADGGEIEIPESLTTAQAKALGDRLRGLGMDAADKGDWRKALYYYEQIQRLPKDVWPADLQVRIAVAKRRAG